MLAGNNSFTYQIMFGEKFGNTLISKGCSDTLLPLESDVMWEAVGLCFLFVVNIIFLLGVP